MPSLTFPTLAAGLADPLGHVVDHSLPGMNWVISNATIMLVLSAIVTALVIIPAARRIATGPARTLDDLRAKGVFANLIETICVYLRDLVFRPVLHDQTDRFAPMLWTFFFFILFCNLLGLVPLIDLSLLVAKLTGYKNPEFHGIGGTATQSIWVTGALAVVAFLFYNGVAIAKDPIGWARHMTGGAPWFMWPIMIPVEIIGMFVKPFALALRLFANMTGGHIIIAVLLGFTAALVDNLGAVGYGMSIIPILGATAIYILEVVVALIQAFIFTFLTCLFLGQLVVHHHDDHGHSDHGEAMHQGHNDEFQDPLQPHTVTAH